MEELDSSAFRGLLDYLATERQPASQTLGMAFRRGEPPDLSKRSWTQPRLYHLVMKFALVCLPADFPFTSAQLFIGDRKFDSHNKGLTYIVRFGSYTGGELVLQTPNDTEHNIRHRPMIFNCTEIEHYFKESEGTPWTLVFYTLTTKHAPIRKLSDYEAVYESNKWSIALHQPGHPITYLSKKLGIPYMAKKKEEEQRAFLGPLKKVKPEPVVDDARYSAAQNLMMRSAVAFNTE